MLWASDIEITKTSSSMPAAMARRAPLPFGTSATLCRPGSGPMRATTSSISAICGIALGLTKEPISIRVTPASTSLWISWSFDSVGTKAAMFCRPSRGATSTISTLAMMFLPAIGTLRACHLRARDLESGAAGDHYRLGSEPFVVGKCSGTGFGPRRWFSSSLADAVSFGSSRVQIISRRTDQRSEKGTLRSRSFEP